MAEDKEQTTQEPEITEEVDSVKIKVINTKIAGSEVKRLKFYEKLRRKLANKLPKSGMMNKVTDYLFLLPDMFMLLCRLMVDDRVDNKTKSFILGVLAYVILPIDLIPDFIPIIGFVDDLIIVVFSLDHIMKSLDEQVLLDNWSGKEDLMLSVKKSLAVINTTIGQRVLLNIKRILFRTKRLR